MTGSASKPEDNINSNPIAMTMSQLYNLSLVVIMSNNMSWARI